MLFLPARRALLVAVPPMALLAAAAAAADWPMWGRSPDRNMVSPETGLPTTWDRDSGENVRWVAELGSDTYGNPVVAGGAVYVGTNNAGRRIPEEDGDRGVLLALRESDGSLLWQASWTKLPSGSVNDWPDVGLCSSPLVEGDRVYVVTNRAELVALDTEGFRDGENDGPFRDEALTGELNADVVWVFDMIAEVGTFPHNMTATSPVRFGDLVFVNTSNGHDESHEHLPSPDAPGLIAIDRNTGRLAWKDSGPGAGVLHGQWSAPAVARVGDVDQVVLGQGDGWVRGWEARTGEPLWEFDTNPKDSEWPRSRNNVIGTPVVWEGRVYIANGQDPENGEGEGHLHAIDASKRGDITESGSVWRYTEIRRSISTAAIQDGVLYLPDFSGFLHALDARTGEPLWVHDTFAAVWGSALVADGKVYLGDEDGDVVVLAAGREEKVLAENNLGQAVYSTPVAANGTLFIATRSRLFALASR